MEDLDISCKIITCPNYNQDMNRKKEVFEQTKNNPLCYNCQYYRDGKIKIKKENERIIKKEAEEQEKHLAILSIKNSLESIAKNLEILVQNGGKTSFQIELQKKY